jgi:alpha-D-ribose 1-methylphosphonate 5-phosphate C-P lyase
MNVTKHGHMNVTMHGHMNVTMHGHMNVTMHGPVNVKFCYLNSVSFVDKFYLWRWSRKSKHVAEFKK